MASIQTIQPSDLITDSRADINSNFANLNSDKIETSVIDTDTTLAANSDSKIPSQKAIKTYVDAGGSAANLERLLPTGSIVPYAGTNAPSYFLLCDGSAVSRTTYANLFAITSTSYGVGDGSTTFNLPDLKGRFPLGYSASAPTKVFTFSSRSSNTITVTSDLLTNSTTNELQTGQKVNFVSTGTTITGLTSGVDYYIIRVAYNQFSLATSVSNANSGTAITLSGDGTGTRTFTVTYTARALGDKGGSETDTTVPSHTHTTNASADTNASGPAGSGTGPNDPATINATGSDTPNNMPLFTVVNYIIKT